MGNLFHQVLETVDTISEDKDTRYSYYQECIQSLKEEERPFTKKEVFYMNNVLEQLDQAVLFVKNIHQTSSFNSIEHESKYSLPLNGSFIKYLNGIVDVILSNDNQYITIDYKTKQEKFYIGHTEYGIDMQLLIYLLI